MRSNIIRNSIYYLPICLFLASNVCFYPRSLNYQSLVSGPPGSVRKWVPFHCMSQFGPVIHWPLPQVLHHHYSSTDSRQNNLRSKVLWLGWSPSPTMEDLPGYRRVSVSLLLGLFTSITLLDFREFLTALGFYLTPEMPTNSTCLSQQCFPPLLPKCPRLHISCSHLQLFPVHSRNSTSTF